MPDIQSNPINNQSMEILINPLYRHLPARLMGEVTKYSCFDM